MNITTVDIAVIGLGAVGAATLYQLSKHGKKILGVDQFAPPHELGSTHGETRISRLAVGEGFDFIPLVQRSHEIWQEIQQATDEKLFYQIGGILMDSGNQAWAKHGSEGFFERTVNFARRADIPYEVFDNKELKKRFREFNLEDTGQVYFEPSAGYVVPELAVASQLSLATKQGAAIKTHTKVLGLKPISGGGVIIETNQGVIEAGQVSISVGAWVKDFVPAFYRSHFKICRQVLHWLPIKPGYFKNTTCPVYMWGFGPNAEDFIYGFPSLDGVSVKMASESFIASHHADTIQRSVSEEEKENFLSKKLTGKFNGIDPSILRSKTCLYTVTPDSNFVVDRLPDFPEVLVSSACSGHGFKHSAGLGEAIANNLLGIDSMLSIKAFHWPSIDF
ncbi:N-methyl-L-tryptophan oxidase [Mongoliitalea daihaiensis]|uniref:N-methyl-L-tryptophan oxidase n=1 Tax=Mongoliitalea daihaiensis TaxID=2782006 RepID=UPI001F2CDA7E|nr:N-methyl-L-tryptophan oxidase [Mongoliitalea daihaiensis]UJP66010.1 N-methyl-L-tryptophan oxidase [Mongoliitalea daihaiensis]